MIIDDTAAMLDVAGIGFGPSNLALAIALDALAPGRRSCFFEKQPEFRWHGGMLLPGSRMQVSFLKDLVTLHDPTSRFTFVNYLHARGRLVDFINQKTFFPSRIEFNDYLCWAAAQFEDRATYGTEVVAVEPFTTNGRLTAFAIRIADAAGRERVVRARSAVVAMGGRPRIPEPFRPLKGEPRLFHSSGYLRHLDRIRLADQAGGRVAVIGGGQSAAEIFSDIRSRFPRVKVDLVLRAAALKPADDSPFVNEIFNPGFTDLIFSQAPARRRAVIDEFRGTNYSVVDLDLIQAIYEDLYQQKVTGEDRLRIRAGQRITGVSAGEGGITLATRDTLSGAAATESYQAVILATGYDRDLPRDLVGALDPHVTGWEPDRLYRVPMADPSGPVLHLQGACEDSHGLSDTLLSVVVIRVHEIATALAAHLDRVDDAAAPVRRPVLAGAGG
ncbi:lysine N(6)-hydroxylase/L-ornithine N(5)-oxygenase family protein (plasmid) [Tistrella mobilis]|uniref:lysine N(6)-hydroxylase/L-ornithine N(5)-oxygenase family protein n=1 Tax=Tistrella mobilis TaxID=171437 RepID=UPI0035587D46